MDEFENGGEAETWTVVVDADTRALRKELSAASGLGRQFGRAMGSAFQDIAVKGKSLGDVLRGLALQLSNIVVKAAFKPLEQGFGNLLGGLLSGGLGGASPGRTAPLPVPFAKGGVIQTPLSFPLGRGGVGLAGERGAEAIMPLARSADGRLGIVAQGGGGQSITVNISTTDADSFRRSQSQVAAMLSRAVAMGNRNL